ncbi:uncharacterized protein [Branchiostoma lanceolatum]|uniref:uncharacterized protein isoform X1 n=1 Tax=Branchiostoma lanceolatum TaxID=7740 RepID=UPI003453B006
MGVDLATYRARIGCFCNPAHGSLRCWAEASCLLVWLVMSQLMLKLAGDVEENPGPKERKASKGNEGQQRQWSPDVQETGANAGGGFVFSPLTQTDQFTLSGQLGIPVAALHESPLPPGQNSVPLECPFNVKSIGGLGNCFFNAISYAVFGIEEYHLALRSLLVAHMQILPHAFCRLFLPTGLSMTDYIVTSQMHFDGTWATDIEIYCMASMLRRPIFVYSYCGTREGWRWMKFSPTGIVREDTDGGYSSGIYLRNTDRNHYDIVTDVMSLEQSRNMSRFQHYRHMQKTKAEQAEQFLAADRLRKANRYAHDEEYKKCKKLQANVRYQSDEVNRKRKNSQKQTRYQTDENHRMEKLEQQQSRYQTDENHKKQKVAHEKTRYHIDENHRLEKLEQQQTRYHTDENRKKGKLEQQQSRYHTDEDHRMEKLEQDRKKYQSDPELRAEKIAQVQNNRRLEHDSIIVEQAVKKFQKECREGLKHVCTVCHKIFFRSQVVVCDRSKFDSSVHGCLTGEYVHKCNKECTRQPCPKVKSHGKEWICYTCKGYLLKKKIPAQAQTNKMSLPEIPPQLKCLNTLESQLVAVRIPFMKVTALPKGGQKGVNGPVVCVPADVSKTHAVLPRMPSEAQFVKVKLKKKLEYRGHYMYRQISPLKVDTALQYLVDNNKHYNGVSVDTDWVVPWTEEGGFIQPAITETEHGHDDTQNHTDGEQQEGSDMVRAAIDGMEDEEMDNILGQINVEKVTEEAALNEDDDDDQLRGLPHDTCLQPVDIGQDFLDHYDEHVLCVAPGEGNRPVFVFKEVGGEAMSFPVQFPTGEYSFNDDRETRITASQYFKARLMGADSRFASDASYIFYAQYVIETHFIRSNISISLRKSSPITSDGRRIGAQMLSDREDVQAILKSDEGYRFLQPVRGTPQFWEKTLNELYAMIRQIGIPTWFVTFSAADLRWPEVLEAIRQDRGTVPVSELTWEERCDILKSNPVTAARMFDHRVKLLFKHLIQSQSQPIGEVVETFSRTEFQARGSPHIHCLLWVKDAPKLNVNSEEEICAFVDRYVCSQLPDSEADKELFDIVSQVQTHRKGHTASCKKGGKVCRFGFPKPPVKQTFMCGPVKLQDLTDAEMASFKGRKKQAEAVLKKFWDVLDKTKEPNKCSTDAILKEADLSAAEFCDAFNLMATRKQVVLRREPKDMWVNNYNPHLLRAWNGNMDIQYVLDAYSCVKYIVSYISKAEREMGKLLKQAQKEAREGNQDVVNEMRKVGNAYLHHREVSAQEAVYRACSLKLKDCSREVIFIPTDEKASRLSKPLAAIQNIASAENGEEESIWMPSIMDRYKARPLEEPFQTMCAAKFVSEYRVVSFSGKQQDGEQPSRGTKKYVLNDNLGSVQKRTRSNPAIIRFAKFNKEKDPERFYLTLLKLYLPHYSDMQLKPEQFAKYEDFYLSGSVLLSERTGVLNVRDIVENNRCQFEKNREELEGARKEVENTSGDLDDAWAQIFPVQEQDRFECQDAQVKVQLFDDEDIEDDIPDLAIVDRTDKSKEQGFTLEKCQLQIASKTALPLMQSLNPMQQDVFYFVRKWCLETAAGKRPEPFHIFVTGGAGTGKSHLIKCICYEATRILKQTQENPDDISVLLTAPTGTAAFNIGGSTVHHAFHLTFGSKYQPLSEKTLNTVRAQYQSLKIVVIDEVSMVDKNVMSFIDGRLGQLTHAHPDAKFGNVSILAVGDMYQLPPVKGKSLCRDRKKEIIDLWNPIFEVVQLEEIMRQKDDAAFAELLNRLRVKRKKDKLSDEDDKTLCSRVLSLDFASDDYPKDALHIFGTNDTVDRHNDNMLILRCSPIRRYEAFDFSKDLCSGSIKRRDLVEGVRDDLLDVLRVGVGARVILCRNVNVEDGLVNGAFGTVTGMKGGEDNASEVATVYVLFDNPRVGAEERQKSAVPKEIPVNSVPVRQIESTLKKIRNVTRHQIPLKLAWACTTHKVQGMTVPKAVVSMKKAFASGMSYVALSRVCSIGGLYITDYKQDSIYCDEQVEEAVKSMRHLQFRCDPFINIDDRSESNRVLNIVHHNTEGLVGHFKSLKSTCLLKADIICLTETWLSGDVQSSQVQLENFTVFRQDRRRVCEADSMTTSSPHGGVAVYVRDGYRCSEIPIPSDIRLECVVMRMSAEGVEILIVPIYRPPNVKKDVFICNLEKLMQHLATVKRNTTIFLGDFNENLISGEDNKKILNFFVTKDFEQLVEDPTTMKGTLIDHVYISPVPSNVSCGVIQTFYSYHDAVYCSLYQ